MDKTTLIVESTISFHELSALITQMEPHHLSHGFIITDHGKYLGLGSGHALLREITEMQISAASYANPLTLLPGNVPINEHIDRMLEKTTHFGPVIVIWIISSHSTTLMGSGVATS